MDSELVDLPELAHDRLHRARIDVGSPDELHVVDPAADAALVEVEGAAAAAGARRNAHDQVAGPVAEDGDEAAPEGGDQPLAQLAVGDRGASRRIDHLLDVVVLDDVRPA